MSKTALVAAVLALVWSWAPPGTSMAADKVLFLPQQLLLDTSTPSGLLKKWGSGTCTSRAAAAGGGVRFSCSGWNTSPWDKKAAYATGWPPSSQAGCDLISNWYSDCSPFRDGDGNDKYRMRITNEHPTCALWAILFMNTGWLPGDPDAYYEGAAGWKWIGPGSTGIVELDLNSATCYNAGCGPGNPQPVNRLNHTTKIGFQLASWQGGACDSASFDIVVSPFAQETSLSTGNNDTITCPGHSLQGYSSSGTLYYNNLDEGFRGYADLSGLLPNHKYLLSFEGLAADVALSSDELSACGVAVDDGGRLTTPGGTWPASGGGEFQGMQVVFVDFEEIITDGSGNYSGSFYFDCNGLISNGDLFKTRFIVKDEHAWSIHDCTGGWENEALYADNVDFDPPFDEDGDGHTTASELGAGSDPGDATSIPLQATTFDGEGKGKPKDQLITYATISARKSSPVLPGRYTMIVNWAPTVDPATFKAKLAKRDATALFQPVIPGTSRVVTLPFDTSRKRRYGRLVLQIRGEVTDSRGVRVRRDRDRLLFLVP